MTEVVTFINQAAQGDMLLTRIDAIPEGAIRVEPINGFYVLAHSETGHNHVTLERPETELYQDPDNAMVSYLPPLRNAHETHWQFSARAC